MRVRRTAAVVTVAVTALAPSLSAASAPTSTPHGGGRVFGCGRYPTGVRPGHAVRIRVRLGSDVAVLKGTAGKAQFMPRLLHGRVSVHIAGLPAEHYRVKPAAGTAGRGALLAAALRPNFKEVFCLTRLSGASAPVASLETYSGANQCCLDLDAFYGTERTRAAVHAATAPAMLVPRRGSAVVRSADPRFTGAFTDYADSNLPIEILTLGSGGFVDASQSFRHTVQHDKRMQWHQFIHPRNGRNHGLGALAAWVADSYVLDNGASAWAKVHRLLHHRRLHGIKGWPHGKAYVRDLHSFLAKTGYVR
jgi:hypothetical protein